MTAPTLPDSWEARMREIAREEIREHFGKHLEITDNGLLKHKTEPWPTPPSHGHGPEQEKDLTCVCDHPKSRHAPEPSVALPPTVLACQVPGCACGPGCIHEGFERADIYDQPAEAKGAPETMLLGWDGDRRIWTQAAEGSPMGRTVNVVRADVVERRVAEAIVSSKHESGWQAMADVLGLTGNESDLDAARRVVAERDAAVKRVAALDAAAQGSVEHGNRLSHIATEQVQRAESAERALSELRTEHERVVGELAASQDAIRKMSHMLATLGQQSVAINATASDLRTAYAEAMKLEIKP